MMLKMPVEYCFILEKGKIDIKVLRENDKFRLSTGVVEQYITDHGVLYGVVSSIDFDRCGENALVEDLICPNPMAVLEGNYERDMTECILQKSPGIKSVPVIDKGGHIQYVYKKLNSNLHNFAELWQEKNLYEYAERIMCAYRDCKKSMSARTCMC